MSAATRTFSALGTYVHLGCTADPDRARAIAERVLAAVDQACSRFRSDSELSRLNRAGGAWVAASPVLLGALTVAVEAARATGGLVDPCLGRPLVSLGYDADLAQVRARPDHPLGAAPRPRPGAWTEIGLTDTAARIPADVAVDLGATAKAWAADLIAEEIADRLGGAVVVSIGGDLRVVGDRAWPVQVTEHPDGAGDDLAPEAVLLDGGGLATSSVRVRRWRAGGVQQHHLLDPRSGRPVAGPWRTVTATGPSSVAANVASTAALVLQDGAVDWLEDHEVDARLVDRDGRVVGTGRWPTVGSDDEVAAC